MSESKEVEEPPLEEIKQRDELGNEIIEEEKKVNPLTKNEKIEMFYELRSQYPDKNPSSIYKLICAYETLGEEAIKKQFNL
jgi:hypothetical protein